MTGAEGVYRTRLPEMHLRIMPGGSATQMLARLVGPFRALELILPGRVLTPDQAMDIGLVDESWRRMR